jgi:hypothetical protein
LPGGSQFCTFTAASGVQKLSIRGFEPDDSLQ